MDRKSVEEKLKKNNYKITQQRGAIIEALLENRGQFVTAEEIYKKTRGRHKKTDFSTVYRNLEILESLGIIHKTSIKDGVAIYELICDHSHHHHIICKGCGKTEIINMCPLEQFKKNVRDKEFTLTDHRFELYGYCRDCNKKE